MESLGYCDKHQRAFEIKCLSGSWVYECPECRKEGVYDAYATTQTKITPVDEWIASNRTKSDL